LNEAALHHTSYSAHNCQCVGPQSPPRPFGRGKKTVRLDHLRAALLAVAAAGLLAAVGLVVVLYAQPAEANYPGKPGKIVYAEEHGNNFVIYTIKANGKGKLRLTAKGANNREPAYGPGGKRIAYSGYDGKDYKIYTIKVGGGNRLNITKNSTEDLYPSYSPSGNKIAYVNIAGPKKDWEIWTIKPKGGGKHRVTNNTNNDRNPYWGRQ
jgi:dipeptidyl aminopeptidase/acylaminoacyl peptidase